MSFAQIEAELGKLTPDELRLLAVKSWEAFVEREERMQAVSECSEDDPRLLTALDEAIAKADSTPGPGHAGAHVRACLTEWISK